MLQPATLAFLSKLEKNNNRAWFDNHRNEYESAKKDFEALVALIHAELAKAEPRMADQKPKDAIFRIFRDVRFSKNKTPYKNHFGAYFSRAGKKAPDAGYYIHIEPGNCFVAGGLWFPEAPLLKATRQEIDYNLDEFNAILRKPAFKKVFKTLEGERLKTLPQGYTADNPAIEYLKMKSFTVSARLDDKDIHSNGLVSKVMKLFILMKPLVDFLNRGLD